MKAGLNEIADVFVVNKADRDGADRMKAELELSVHLRPAGGWRPLVVLTQAAADIGIDGLVAAVERHREYQQANHDPIREQERRAHEFIEVLTSEMEERTIRAIHAEQDGVRPIMGEVRAGKLNPYSAARRIIEDNAMVRELLGSRTEGERQE